MVAFGVAGALDPGPPSYNFWPLLFMPLATAVLIVAVASLRRGRPHRA
ncbi:MAG TPA: hypothetical protein VF984_01755 [Actinomycetota bacterium]